MQRQKYWLRELIFCTTGGHISRMHLVSPFKHRSFTDFRLFDTEVLTALWVECLQILLVSYLVDSNWKIDIKGKIWGNFAWPRTIRYQVEYSTFSNTQHTQHYFRFHCTVFNNNIQQGPKVWSTLKTWDLKSNLGTFKTFSTTSLLQIKDLVLSGSLITGCIWTVNLKRAFPTQFIFMEIPGRLRV